MSLKSKHSGCFLLAALLLMASQPGMAQEAQTPEDDGSSTSQQFGGPNSVPGQLADDERLSESLTGVTVPQTLSDWKKGLRD